MSIIRKNPLKKRALLRQEKEVAKKNERQVEVAFKDIAFNRKTINALSSKIKAYWARGKEMLEEKKKIYDFLGIKEAKQMREISREYKSGAEAYPALCKQYDVSEQKLTQLVFKTKKIF